MKETETIQTHSADQEAMERLRQLATAKIGPLLWRYSLPAVIGIVVTALYNLIDSIVIGHAIDDPNVIAGIAVTFPVMTLSGALGMLIGVGCHAYLYSPGAERQASC